MINKIHAYLSKRPNIVIYAILLLTTLTLALTLLPVDKVMPSKLWTYDKLGHLGIFGGWTFLVGYYRYLLDPESINLLVIFVIGVAFGVAVEFLQYMMPLNRTADLFDIAFDALGCFIATLALYKITER